MTLYLFNLVHAFETLRRRRLGTVPPTRNLDDLLSAMHGGDITASQLWQILGKVQIKFYLWAIPMLFGVATSIAWAAFAIGKFVGETSAAASPKATGNVVADLDPPAGKAIVPPQRQPNDWKLGIKVSDTPSGPAKPSLSEPLGGVTKSGTSAETSKSTPEKTTISLFEFAALKRDNTVPPLQRDRNLNPYLDKTVDWYGYYGEASLHASDDRPILVTLRHSPDRFATWCDLASKYEQTVNSLKKNQPLHITGFLKRTGKLEGELFELVETSPNSMTSYFDQLADPKQSILKILEKHVGKHVDWMGYFYSMDFIDDKHKVIRLLLVPRMEKIAEYLYCNVPSEIKGALPEMHQGQMLHVAGILTRRNELKLTALAVIGSDEDWKPDAIP